jgi:hypothetical protein
MAEGLKKEAFLLCSPGPQIRTEELKRDSMEGTYHVDLSHLHQHRDVGLAIYSDYVEVKSQSWTQSSSLEDLTIMHQQCLWSC